ncbi:MAG: hypothetical protein JJE40_03220 [Vicinamibacteria bacterium]|nr:hypothetical protein [Vicinamibacteria bacterium]
MTTVLIRRTVCLGLLATVVAGASGCSSTVREGRSPAYLIVQRIEAASGAEDDIFSDELSSDVLTNNSVFEDLARVTFRLGLKDIGPAGVPTSPTANNFITVNRYTVTFRRTDGRNAPGVDVPYPFEGAGTVTVLATDSTMSFVIVRTQAKVESPLRELTNGGTVRTISTIADITFYGRDQAGNDVSVSGAISVNFSDWGDPDA